MNEKVTERDVFRFDDDGCSEVETVGGTLAEEEPRLMRCSGGAEEVYKGNIYQAER